MTKNLNIKAIPNLEFHFETQDEYLKARASGYIEDYKMARIKRVYEDGNSIDCPYHSKEEFVKSISLYLTRTDIVELEAYQSEHFFDIMDYD